MIWVFGIISIFYFLLILFLFFGFGKVPVHVPAEAAADNSFLIIIPFRNERKNLEALFASLLAMDYSREAFEIIFVNDNSEDDSEELCRSFIDSHPDLQMKLLNSVRSSGSPKKDAIRTAIDASAFPYILTTDADCTVPPGWLQNYSSILQETGADLVAGPVVLNRKKGTLNTFQELDFLSLQAATIGAFGIGKPIMCNGANLCYRKEAFLEAEGFKGNEGIASGDDIFLLGKFVADNKRTAFLKSPEAIVSTQAQPDLSSLFSQRIRWAAKTSAYEDPFAKMVGVAVILMNLLLVLGVIFLAAGYDVKQVLLFSFFLKFNADFMLIYRGAEFFGREKSMKSYFWVCLLYPFFCTTVGILSIFSGYTWKGRSFRK